MPAAEFDQRNGGPRRVLFVQATEPAAYPPLIHASSLMAQAGWDVTFLSAPIEGDRLELPHHPRIALRAISPRPSHVMGKAAYARYATAAARLALRLRPDVVYVSDPLGAGPGLFAARLARARARALSTTSMTARLWIRRAPRSHGRALLLRGGQSSSFIRMRRAHASRRPSSAFLQIVSASSGTCRVWQNYRRSTAGPRNRSYFIITGASHPIVCL